MLLVFSRAVAKNNRRWAERFRVVHYSIQNNHVHLLVEAEDKESLSRGMQGLSIRLTLSINKVLRRRGSLWTDRFHARALTGPAEVRTVLVYVHANFRKHEPGLRPGVDPYSSGLWFDGWWETGPLPLALSISRKVLDACSSPAVSARTWLLRVGWKRHGPISWTERPRVELIGHK